MPRKKQPRIILQFDVLHTDQIIRDLNKFRDELLKMTNYGDHYPRNAKGKITLYFDEGDVDFRALEKAFRSPSIEELEKDPDYSEAIKAFKTPSNEELEENEEYQQLKSAFLGDSKALRDPTKNLAENIKIIRDED